MVDKKIFVFLVGIFLVLSVGVVSAGFWDWFLGPKMSPGGISALATQSGSCPAGFEALGNYKGANGQTDFFICYKSGSCGISDVMTVKSLSCPSGWTKLGVYLGVGSGNPAFAICYKSDGCGVEDIQTIREDVGSCPTYYSQLGVYEAKDWKNFRICVKKKDVGDGGGSECTIERQLVCNDAGTGVKECVNGVWVLRSCPSGETCQNGLCVGGGIVAVTKPTVSTFCDGVSKANIIWSGALGTDGKYWVEIDEGGEVTGAIWKKGVTGTIATAPDGFSPASGETGTLALQNGEIYSVRVFNGAYSETTVFAAAGCAAIPGQGCADTDEADNINYEQENTNGFIMPGKATKGNDVFADICMGEMIQEAYCDTNGNLQHTAVKSCKDGFRCFVYDGLGYCARRTGDDSGGGGSCTDSDVNSDYPDGKNPLVEGTTTSGGTSWTDRCANPSQVEEGYCDASSSTGMKTTTLPCPDGSCRYGACVSVSGEEDETSGGEEETSGGEEEVITGECDRIGPIKGVKGKNGNQLCNDVGYESCDNNQKPACTGLSQIYWSCLRGIRDCDQVLGGWGILGGTLGVDVRVTCCN